MGKDGHKENRDGVAGTPERLVTRTVRTPVALVQEGREEKG
jgi:hypothetical protein